MIWTSRLARGLTPAFAVASCLALAGLSLNAEGNAESASIRGKLPNGSEISGTVGLSQPHWSEGRADIREFPILPVMDLAGRPARGLAGGEVGGSVEWSGPLGEPACLLGEPVCGGTDCLLGGLAQRVNREVRSYLTETTLAALAGRVAFAGLANKVGTSVSSDV